MNDITQAHVLHCTLLLCLPVCVCVCVHALLYYTCTMKTAWTERPDTRQDNKGRGRDEGSDYFSRQLLGCKTSYYYTAYLLSCQSSILAVLFV